MTNYIPIQSLSNVFFRFISRDFYLLSFLFTKELSFPWEVAYKHGRITFFLRDSDNFSRVIRTQFNGVTCHV